MGQSKRSFVIQVHGLHFSNPDGSSRQEVIARCRRGQRIEFEPEPTNPHDANAVKVLAVGQTIGYIPAKFSARFAQQLRDGEILAGSINRIYVLDDGTNGVELRVRLREGAGAPVSETSSSDSATGCLVLIVLAFLIYLLARAFALRLRGTTAELSSDHHALVEDSNRRQETLYDAPLVCILVKTGQFCFDRCDQSS